MRQFTRSFVDECLNLGRDFAGRGGPMLKKKRALRLVNQPFYRYWQALYLCFYSPRLYIDVAKRWHGLGLCYALFVLSIFLIPISTKYTLRFYDYVYHDFFEPFTRVPAIKIEHGRASFDIKMPYYIKNKQGKILIVLDTTGDIKQFNRTNYPDLIALFTNKDCYFRDPVSTFIRHNQKVTYENTLETLSFSQLPDGQFDLGHWIAHQTDLMRIIYALLFSIYPFFVWTSWGIIVTLILALTFVGQVTSYLLFRFKLSFKVACRLMMVASTPAMFIFFILKMFALTYSGINLYCTLIAYTYFCFAALAVRRDSYKLLHVSSGI